MSSVAKIVNKIPATQTQQHTERIIDHEPLGFIPGIQGCLNTDRIREIIHTVITVDGEKSFDKSHHPFMIKSLNKVGIEGNNLNIVEAANKIKNTQQTNHAQ